jgi:Homeodomain-like domain
MCQGSGSAPCLERHAALGEEVPRPPQQQLGRYLITTARDVGRQVQRFDILLASADSLAINSPRPADLAFPLGSGGLHHQRRAGPGMSTGHGRDDIPVLFGELDDELRRRGAHADLFLVGGAAIAVADDGARSTRGLDAVFLPTEVVRRAAQAVAERRGLASDWLNDAVKRFLPGPDPDATRHYEGDSLTVDVASARVKCLLAEIVDALAGERLPPTPGNVGGSLAAARRHGNEVETARQKMLASARARRAAIFEAHQAGISIRRIAAELGCSPAVVQNAVRAARAESDGDAPEDGSR